MSPSNSSVLLVVPAGQRQTLAPAYWLTSQRYSRCFFVSSLMSDLRHHNFIDPGSLRYNPRLRRHELTGDHSEPNVCYPQSRSQFGNELGTRNCSACIL